MGGPMMGMTQYTIILLLIKGLQEYFVYDKEAKIPEPSNCLRCGDVHKYVQHFYNHYI